MRRFLARRIVPLTAGEYSGADEDGLVDAHCGKGSGEMLVEV